MAHYIGCCCRRMTLSVPRLHPEANRYFRFNVASNRPTQWLRRLYTQGTI